MKLWTRLTDRILGWSRLVGWYEYFYSDLDSIAEKHFFSMSASDIAKYFSAGKKDCVRNIKQLKQEIKELREKSLESRDMILLSRYAYENEMQSLAFVDGVFNYAISLKEARLKELQVILRHMENRENFKEENQESFEKKIALARDRQIDEFEDFNQSGFAKSVWNPNERTPSMKYYKNKNRVWCYSTHQGADIIKFIMVKNNLSFVEAVDFLQ